MKNKCSESIQFLNFYRLIVFIFQLCNRLSASPSLRHMELQSVTSVSCSLTHPGSNNDIPHHIIQHPGTRCLIAPNPWAPHITGRAGRRAAEDSCSSLSLSAGFRTHCCE